MALYEPQASHLKKVTEIEEYLLDKIVFCEGLAKR